MLSLQEGKVSDLYALPKVFLTKHYLVFEYYRESIMGHDK